MNRKTFLKTTAATLLATSVEGLQAKGFAATTPPSEGLQVRFLGTGAADWKGRDERGEHRRLSSILLDDSIFIQKCSSRNIRSIIIHIRNQRFLCQRFFIYIENK